MTGARSWTGPSGPGPLRARASTSADLTCRARARSTKIAPDLDRTGLRTVYSKIPNLTKVNNWQKYHLWDEI